MKPIVRLAIIGCGMISRFHIDAIRQIKTAELAGVYDPRTEAAERVATGTRPSEPTGLWTSCGTTGLSMRVHLYAVRHAWSAWPLTRCAMANMCSLKSLWRL